MILNVFQIPAWTDNNPDYVSDSGVAKQWFWLCFRFQCWQAKILNVFQIPAWTGNDPDCVFEILEWTPHDPDCVSDSGVVRPWSWTTSTRCVPGRSSRTRRPGNTTSCSVRNSTSVNFCNKSSVFKFLIQVSTLYREAWSEYGKKFTKRWRQSF